MNFTPQQLAGAGKYGSKVLIGNWNEELALRDVQRKAIVDKRERGERLADARSKSTWAGTQPPVLDAPEGDGLVPYGNSVALQHELTGKWLASHTGARQITGRTGMREVAASGVAEPSLRTCFRILPYRDEGKPHVEFGDEIVLASHPLLRVDPRSGLCQRPFYLISAPRSTLASADGEQQGVRAALQVGPGSSSYLRWKIERVRPDALALESDRRLRVGEPFQLVHCATGQALALDLSCPCYTEYGQEWDAFCCLDHKPNKVAVLTHEHRGLRAPELRVPVNARNAWRLVAAERGNQDCCEPSTGGDESAPPRLAESKAELQFASPDIVLELVRREHAGRLEELEAHLSGLDEVGDGRLDAVTFKWGLTDCGVELSEDEFDCLLTAVVAGDGSVSVPYFVSVLRS